MKFVFTWLLLALSLVAHAETEGWVSSDGRPIPNSDSIKSIDGFGGSLVVTPDADWEEKWNTTSPDTAPRFSEAKEVLYGERLTIRIFFVNPKIDASGMINVLCDIKVTKPDGGSSTHVNDFECAKVKLQGDPKYVRLASAVLKYVGDAEDPPGKWIVEVTLKDKVRGTAIPLKTQFILRANANQPLNADAPQDNVPH